MTTIAKTPFGRVLLLAAAAGLLLLAFLAGYLTGSRTGQQRPDAWTLLADDVTATVYNAVPAQCNDDPLHTASMYRLDGPDDVLKHRIIAMERTMMAEYGLSYGDVVLVEGTGRWDGVWQIQDTMNRRFRGKHKIDILVPTHIRHGKWTGVRVSVPADRTTRERYAFAKR